MYDSRPDTWEHIHEVQSRLRQVANELLDRAHGHDQSKLYSPEVEVFDEYTPKLKDSTYGSDEYKSFLEGMKPGLDHHYKHNDHHPEHFERGVHQMNLIQLIEMLADWKAATLRHDDSDLGKSIQINSKRFNFGPEMARLLRMTAYDLGWL